MTGTTCTHCTAEVTNGLTLCARCQETLTVALVNLAAYHGDVLRIRPGERVKVRSTYRSTPPPATEDGYDPISAATRAADSTLELWCDQLMRRRANVGMAPTGAVRQCAWLEQHVAAIATLDFADQLLRDVIHHERRLQAILDRSDTGWYAGKCGAILEDERIHDVTSCACACHQGPATQIAPGTFLVGDLECDVPGGCGAEITTIEAVHCERGLYATPGHGWIRCPECGTTHNTASRRDQMMTEARDQVAPVSVIARVVVGLVDTEQSVARLTSRIDQWVHRGQLHDLGVRVLEGRPRRVYRLGDVFDLLDRRVPQNQEEAC